MSLSVLGPGHPGPGPMDENWGDRESKRTWHTKPESAKECMDTNEKRRVHNLIYRFSGNLWTQSLPVQSKSLVAAVPLSSAAPPAVVAPAVCCRLWSGAEVKPPHLQTDQLPQTGKDTLPLASIDPMPSTLTENQVIFRASATIPQDVFLLCSRRFK